MINNFNEDIKSIISNSNIPESKYIKLKYRDLSSSSLFNENQSSIISDILDLYNKANKIEEMLIEANSIFDNETNYSKFKIKRLESEIENIKERYEAIILSKEYFKSYIYPFDILSTSTVNIDSQCNCITVFPNRYETKTYIKNEITNDVYVPNDIVCNIKYENLYKEADIFNEKENDISLSYNGNNNSYWIRKVIVSNENINNIIFSYELEIPDSIINSRNINELIIMPYPTNSIDILNIEYKTFNGSYEQLPNYFDYCMNQNDFNVRWNSNSEGYELIDVDSLKFNFNDIEAHRIKITASQKYFVSNENNTKTFIIGFKCVEPRYNYYNTNNHKINFIIDFPKNKAIQFESIFPVYTNSAQINNTSIKFDYYNLYPNGAKTKILNKAPFICATNQLYVECYIKAEDCSPNIIKFEAKYKYSK